MAFEITAQNGLICVRMGDASLVLPESDCPALAEFIAMVGEESGE